MQRRMRILGCIMGAVLMVLGATGIVWAQDFPTHPIELYIGYAAGGTTDLLGRAVANYGGKYIGQTVIPVNKPGASGTIASQYVATAKPDGYTLLMGGGSETTSAGHFQKLPFHPLNDFEPVIRFVQMPIGLNVKADSPWKTMKDFMAAAKANPGKYSVAVSGVGTHYHAVILVLEQETGIKLRHVPFNGESENLSALLGGHVDMAVAAPEAAAPLIEAGMVRQLGHFSDTRTSLVPNIPTMRELGYNIYIENMKGLMVPKGTPKPIIQKLHDSFRKLVDDPDYKASLLKLKMQGAYLNSEDFGKAMRSMYDQIGASLKKK
jgi:tripartite-type tricarboxylate transporter receptor subunit TctC